MSPLKDLRAKYHASEARQAINRAIRAECPGGSEALDALELMHKILRRTGETEAAGTPTIAKVAYDRLCGIANAMEASVRDEWGMPPLATEDEL